MAARKKQEPVSGCIYKEPRQPPCNKHVKDGSAYCPHHCIVEQDKTDAPHRAAKKRADTLARKRLFEQMLRESPMRVP